MIQNLFIVHLHAQSDKYSAACF